MHRGRRRVCLLLPLTRRHSGPELSYAPCGLSTDATSTEERAWSPPRSPQPASPVRLRGHPGALCVLGLLLFVLPTTRHVKVVRVVTTDKVGSRVTSTPPLPAASAGVQPGRTPAYETETGAPSTPATAAGSAAGTTPVAHSVLPSGATASFARLSCHTSRARRACRGPAGRRQRADTGRGHSGSWLEHHQGTRARRAADGPAAQGD